jgi:hypothetical protein
MMPTTPRQGLVNLDHTGSLAQGIYLHTTVSPANPTRRFSEMDRQILYIGYPFPFTSWFLPARIGDSLVTC